MNENLFSIVKNELAAAENELAALDARRKVLLEKICSLAFSVGGKMFIQGGLKASKRARKAICRFVKANG